MTEQESIAVIKEMISRTRTNFKEQSFFYLLWGWLVVASLCTEALLYNQNIEYHWIVWPIMSVIGGVWSSLYGRRMGKRAGYNTHMDRVMMFVWVGMIVYLVLVLLNTPKYGFTTAFMLLGGIYGLGTFISGGILKFKPLIYGGVASFLLVLIAAIYPDVVSSFNRAMLFLAASIVFSYLIPGYMLKNSK
ncbi:hypothetical protein [Owenweeksia hongkongensis]|uniref:hypothetical protein n=1 Tax=Owenweeksia hongkongensis TaxID=253245 RepID=UPI003A944955